MELSSAHPDVELVAVVTRRPDSAIDAPFGTRVLDCLEEAARLFPDATVLHATHALEADLADVLGESARLGLSVVTSSALFDPASELADRGEELDELARANGARVVATGVNPGFVLDVLPATLLDLAPGWMEARVSKPSDARSWPRSTRHMLGIGEAPQTLEAHIPVSLRPSACLVADSVGYEVVSLIETRAARVLSSELVLHDETIAGGRAVGFRQECTAMLEGGRVLSIAWEPRLDIGDDPDLALRLDVNGRAWMSLVLDGEFCTNPYPATAARMLHTAARVRALPAGLHRIIDVGLSWGD